MIKMHLTDLTNVKTDFLSCSPCWCGVVMQNFASTDLLNNFVQTLNSKISISKMGVKLHSNTVF